MPTSQQIPNKKSQTSDSITLSDGKVLKISTTPVFYFLAQCANESIGLKINSMTVIDGSSSTVVDTDLSANASVDFSAGGWGFYMNTTEGRGVATVAAGNSRQVGMWAAAKFGWGNWWINEWNMHSNPWWWWKDTPWWTWTWPGWSWSDWWAPNNGGW